MELVVSIVLLVLSANLDTFVLMLPFGVSHVRIRAKCMLLIAGITSAFTYMSMKVGAAFTTVISLKTANLLGGITMLAIGAYFIIKFFVQIYRQKKEEGPENISGLQMQEEKTMSGLEAVILSLVLSINNAGIGIAAGITSFSAAYVSVATFLCTLLCIKLGLTAGKNLMGRWVTKYSVLLSGAMLFVLGLYECIG